MHPLTRREKYLFGLLIFVFSLWWRCCCYGSSAHDQNFEFAKKYDLPIKQVIVGDEGIKKNQLKHSLVRVN